MQPFAHATEQSYPWAPGSRRACRSGPDNQLGPGGQWGRALFSSEPAWDRKLPAGFRFLVLTNWEERGGVGCRETGLVWERTPDTLPAVMGWSKDCLPQQDREQPERLAAAPRL